MLFGIVDACFIPAVGAMPARLVPAHELTRLQAWRITGLRIANTAGSALGAVLLMAGSAWAFAALAALFAASVLLLRTIRARPSDAAAQAPHADVAGSGWRAVRRLRILPLVLGTALSELPFSGPIAAAVVLLVQDRGWPPAAAGAVLAGFSIGGLATSLLLSVLPRTGGGAAGGNSCAVTAARLLIFASPPDAGVALIADVAGLAAFFAAAAGILAASGALLAVTRFGPAGALAPARM